MSMEAQIRQAFRVFDEDNSGTLLHPSRPASAIDASLLSTAFGDALGAIDKGLGFSTWGMFAQVQHTPRE